MFRYKLWVFTVLTLQLLALAEDWPQFRGPGGQGHSQDGRVPLTWSEAENVLWKVPVPGLGWSSPVTAEGRVWLTTAIEQNGAVSLRALAYALDTGRELVNAEVFRLRNVQLTNAKNSHASPTAIVENGRVYVHFGKHGTAALTTAGEVVWRTTLPYESQHGNGGSPIVFEDLLILSCDGADQAYVIALDKHTGKTRWKVSRRQPWDQAYSTPLAIKVNGRDQIVSAGAHRAAAYDPASGREIWRVSYPNGFSNVPRPVYANSLVYIATGFQEPALLAVRPDGTGDVTRTHVVWRLTRGAPHTPSPLAIGQELYIVSDIGIATCVDAATGRVRWQQRIGGNHSASPVFAGGRIYIQSEEGITTVLAPGPQFQRLGTSTLDGVTFASPAITGNSFLIRSNTHLYRIAEL
jgi:outer membrane protein assembly factor BamB